MQPFSGPDLAMDGLRRPTPGARLVVVGSVLVDITMFVDKLPSRATDVMAQHSHIASGAGFNVLTAASRFGLTVSLAGLVGDGLNGSRVKQDLADIGVIDQLQTARQDTGIVVVLVEPGGERTFITSPGVEAHLSLRHLESFDFLPNDTIYISGYDLSYLSSGPELCAWIAGLANSHYVIMDPGPIAAAICDPSSNHRLLSVMDEAISRADLLSLNGDEAKMITGNPDPATTATLLTTKLKGNGVVVVRVGHDGCWVASKDFEPVHFPAVPAKACDSTGAGDTHVGVMAARLTAGDNFFDAARIANAAASRSVERIGGATCPTPDQLTILDYKLGSTANTNAKAFGQDYNQHEK